jgi:NAD(P)-dependent dehydrogenase (short-subunit alcohol dehydrogenase family)
VREGEELESRAMRDKGAAGGPSGKSAAKRAGRSKAVPARPAVAQGGRQEGRRQQEQGPQGAALNSIERSKDMAAGKAARVAIVTGGGSGIGKAAALALLADGWKVAVAGRRADVLEAALKEADAGDRGLAVATDVGDAAQVEALFARTVQAFGRVDMVFNNAGMGLGGAPLEDIAIEDWKRVVDTNLNGMFYCIREAFRVMKAQSPRGGRIINNGSISAHAPRPGSIAYTATKHAVTGLTKTASLDGRKHDIAVGQIDIGNAMTELAARMAKGVPQANGEIAVEPLMDVSIVGQSVLYMANLPLEANVLFHTVMATKMPFVGRG